MVTGASGGIGLEIVRQAAARGDRVIAASRQGSPALRKLAGAHPDRVLELTLDPGSQESVIAARAKLDGRVEAIDILINNAGV